jgi:branched-chain amino acid aminotransferase
MMTKAKICGNYVNSVFAKREATRAGYDEALMLDTDGYVAEASGENIFMVKNGLIKTPPLTSILPGITRASIFTIIKDKGMQLVEQRFTRDELYTANEVFITGTAAEITPVREIDDRKVGSGRPGPITKEIQSTFFKAVHGELKQYESWISYL